jgi:hypothetical protein
VCLKLSPAAFDALDVKARQERISIPELIRRHLHLLSESLRVVGRGNEQQSRETERTSVTDRRGALAAMSVSNGLRSATV